MSSLKADFDELRERIKHGREVGHASFEPIFYLVFSPEDILEVKRQTPAWISKLQKTVGLFNLLDRRTYQLDFASDPRRPRGSW
jgi:hypothetical protein